ncbi:hypothetical protein Tco_0093152 [Tanacetum coccineum]
MEECHKLLTDQVDDTILRYNVSKPLPLGGEPGHECKYDYRSLCIVSLTGGYKDNNLQLDLFSSEETSSSKDSYAYLECVPNRSSFSMYDGYNYMKKIVLHRADLKEYVIAERDFKYMYPSDFEDQNLVIRQRVEDFQLGIESYQTQLNLTKPRWEATGFEFKHDFTIIDSPRAVIFRDRYGVQMIMRTNPGMNARFWTKKDVDRSKDFMFAIQKRLKTRRIFRNLESFVGGRSRRATTVTVETE